VATPQRRVGLAGLIAAIAVGVFPPMSITVTWLGPVPIGRTEHFFIFDTPPPPWHVDLGRLVLYWGLVVLATIVVFLGIEREF
jgi:hypothetical protein